MTNKKEKKKDPARIEMYSLSCRYMYSRRWFYAIRKYLLELLYCNDDNNNITQQNTKKKKNK